MLRAAPRELRHAPAADPAAAPARLVRGRSGDALFEPESSRLFGLEQGLAAALRSVIDAGDYDRVRSMMAAAGMLEPVPEHRAPLSIPVRTISLAVAGTCNLACTYCYAEGGSFGGAGRAMPEATALAAVERLIASAPAGDEVRIVFLGGEPLANRRVLKAATEHAITLARDADVAVGFSLTTNATQLTPADAAFFDAHSFAVTISVDGVGSSHDALRPDRAGRSTYDRVISRARLLLERTNRRCHVAARTSVTPDNLNLASTLVELAQLGFDSIQFSPVLSSPSGNGEMRPEALEEMLAEMIGCGKLFEAELRNGRVLPFANLISALRRIHQRAVDQYPCGAGGSYAALSASGALYACHRFVDDERARLGNSDSGIDPVLQAGWLRQRNVYEQSPCRTCWARHLCGGGCHFEVIRRGRPACDYIRGWLDYCLSTYLRIHEEIPGALEAILPRKAARGGSHGEPQDRYLCSGGRSGRGDSCGSTGGTRS